MFAHLSTLSVWIGIPFGNIIGPLVIWMMQKDKMPFVDDQAKDALNFQITMTIASIVSLLLCFIGIPLLFVVIVFDVWVTIIAALKSNEGIAYRYPLSIRFVS